MKLIKNFFIKYENYLSPGALVTGFIWDNLTLQRIDLWLENVVILVYLFVTGASILFLNAHSAGKLRHRFSDKFASIVPLVLQFGFGGLFSAFVVFYTKSATFITSWPFMLFLAVLLIGNELFQKKYHRLTFQMSIFFIALFSYSIFAVPVMIGKMGAWVFVLSGFFSLLLFSFVLFILYYINPERVKQTKHFLIWSIGAIFLTFNIFYFTNIIPPVPLSLKDGGIYHYVDRVETGEYFVEYESPPWYLFFKDFNPTFHWVPGTKVYSYSSVFAPTKLNTKISHRWSYYDERKGEWTVLDTLPYTIVGGRDGGYRGYSFKSNMMAGEWRVDIITERGQLLGRMNFDVVQVEAPPKLKVDLK
ncbi:MAG: DUF2914 domain-containing protein [Parcubacteria group bacterium]|nr:DUF2914 domain-containing protein [Parcubacteria group bacterium]